VAGADARAGEAMTADIPKEPSTCMAFEQMENKLLNM